MKKGITLLLLIVLSFCAGIAGAFTFYKQQLKNAPVVYDAPYSIPSARAGYTSAVESADFVKASEAATPCVVYIKVKIPGKQSTAFWDPFFDFFGNFGPSEASGSGVIVTADGYIVTNAHVVDGATEIQVNLNKHNKNYTAKVIGIDKSTDLALIKIEAKDLPFIQFTNSDNLKTGQWVVAVGNPFNLASTVTAGIVSARGRNLNIVKAQFPIESFIQTDAAINPGNSGGALVNTDGYLVGINSAILSKTGSYAGYGFAIPSNIVKKVITDLKESGYVMRAFLEADVMDLDDRTANKFNGDVSGVYVADISKGGNADNAGIKPGDLIIKADGRVIESRAFFDEQLAYHRPGDKIKITILSDGQEFEKTVTLTNQQGTTSLEKTKVYHSDKLNCDFTEISKMEKEKAGVERGFRISNIGPGTMQRYGLPEGFIIVTFNGKTYTDVPSLERDMLTAGGKVTIQGVTPEGVKGTYSFYLF
jgi:Do/DeqQ family serine protease